MTAFCRADQGLLVPVGHCMILCIYTKTNKGSSETEKQKLTMVCLASESKVGKKKESGYNETFDYKGLIDIPSSLRSHTRRVLSLDAETSIRLPSGANVKSLTISVWSIRFSRSFPAASHQITQTINKSTASSGEFYGL